MVLLLWMKKETSKPIRIRIHHRFHDQRAAFGSHRRHVSHIAHYGCELLLTVTLSRDLCRTKVDSKTCHQHLIRISLLEPHKGPTSPIVSYHTIPSTPLAPSQVASSRKNAKDDDAIG
jgi:hypothetical protein